MHAWSAHTRPQNGIPLAICLTLLLLGATGCSVQVDDVMVTMPDDVRLATTCYLPRGHGPWPSVLIRTPYGRHSDRDSLYAIARNGVACVVQDARGRFGSEGEDMVFFADRQDGQATLAWIAAQPWSNGAIVTLGGSALGITQYLMAPDAPESLKFQVIQVATPDLYAGVAYQGGVYRDGLVTNWLVGNGSDHMLDAFMSHYRNDSFWDPVQLAGRYDQVRVPALHIGGWYDIFARNTIDGFLGYQHQGGDGAAGSQHLVMGPWHHSIGNPEVGELTFPHTTPRPDSALLDLAARAYLFGDNASHVALREQAPIHYFTMGAVDETDAPGNTWRTAADWPPEPAQYPPTLIYLHPMAGQTSSGLLSPELPGGADPGYTFTYDPLDPSPTVGGANLNLARGAFDQRNVEARADVLVYTSAELTQPVEVTGDLQARIWITTDVVDTDIAVRLCDVYPDGRSMLVCDSIARARFRTSPDCSTETLLTPGAPALVTVDLGPTSIIFNAGHCIRASVTSSNAPRFAPNPNTGQPYLVDNQALTAHTTVLHDAAHPSALILPLQVYE